jgi:hypothetical protein
METTVRKLFRNPIFHFCLTTGIVASAVLLSKKCSRFIAQQVLKIPLGDGVFIIRYPTGRIVIQYPLFQRNGKKINIEIPAPIDAVQQMEALLLA